MQTVTSMLDKMMRYQIEILRRIGGHAQVENPPPEMAMEVRTCNCSHQVETSTSRMMAELFNEDTCIYNDTELPACTRDVKELRHAVNDLCSEFKERGCTIKKTEVGCIVLHIQCSSILSLLTLLRDYVDGTLDILLKKLEEAARSLNGCEKLRLETVIYVDEFNRVLSALNFEQFLKEDPSSDLTLPEDFQILETATVDNNLPSATKIKSAYKELKHQENTVSSRSINEKRKTEPGLTRSTAYQEGKEWNRTFSSVVCFLLDNLGYSDDMRKYRECANDAIVNLESRHFRFSGITLIAVGSRAEGASLPLCGGTDLMFVTQDVSCVENNFISSDFHILKAERNDSVPPGYTRVAAVDTKDLAILGQIISSSKFHFTQDGISYVSCAIFKNISKKKLLSLQILSKADQVIGPSCFVTDGNTVFSICFYSSLYTSKLATRLSRRDWFSRSLIDNICSTEGYIVPMGSSKGENPDLEWRISYVMTENKIIRNLNSTQFKLYIIMKMIAKELIYQDFPVISSYVVKNVVLWICELNSEVRDSNPRVCSLTSSPDLLLDQIVKCLSFMRTCAIKNHLPNYVIPERNLIAFRPTLRNKQKLINRLDDLIKEGRNIFCRLNIFKKHSQLSLILAPSSIFFYGKKRDEIEKLLLLLMGCLLIKHFVIDQLCGKTGSLEDFHISDQRLLALTSELADLVVPERMILSGNFQMLSSLLDRRLKQYLS